MVSVDEKTGICGRVGARIVEMAGTYALPAVGVAMTIQATYMKGFWRDGTVLIATLVLLSAAAYAKHPVLLRLEVLLLLSNIANLLSYLSPFNDYRVPFAFGTSFSGILWLRHSGHLTPLSSLAAAGFSFLMFGWAFGFTSYGIFGYTLGSLSLTIYTTIDYLTHRRLVSLYWVFLNGWFLLVGLHQLALMAVGGGVGASRFGTVAPSRVMSAISQLTTNESHSIPHPAVGNSHKMVANDFFTAPTAVIGL